MAPRERRVDSRDEPAPRAPAAGDREAVDGDPRALHRAAAQEDVTGDGRLVRAPGLPETEADRAAVDLDPRRRCAGARDRPLRRRGGRGDMEAGDLRAGDRAARAGGVLRAVDREHLQQRGEAAVRRGRRAAHGDGDVLLATRAEHGRAARDWAAGLERPEDLPGLERERAQHTVAAAGEADAARSRRDAAALGLGRLELPDTAGGVDVDRADRAVVVPVLEGGPEVAVQQAEVHVTEQELAALLRRRELLLDQHGG